MAALLGAALVVVACTPTTASREVRVYVEDAVAAMGDGIRTGSATWEARRDAAVDAMLSEDSVADTYPALNALAIEAGGNHSRFMAPAQAEAATTTSETAQLPDAMYDGWVGIIRLPAFNSRDADLQRQYVDAALQAYARSDAPCGWVVDLRGNGGGNMYPMLAAVAPLITDGVVLRLADDTEHVRVEVSNGVLTSPADSVAGSSSVASLDAPVALLTSSATASAAEAVVISFLGQDRVRTFGGSTAGMTTGNESFEMSDGALLVLTTSFMVDRSGTRHDGPLMPDVPVNPRARTDALDVASAWLTAQCSR